MGLRFNPPPGWPPPPAGFVPPPGWQPDPSWPPPPPGWQLWVPDDTEPTPGPMPPMPGPTPAVGVPGPAGPAPYGGPPSAYPAGQAPYGAPAAAERPRTSGFAIASLVFGIIGGILLSVGFGIAALVKIRGNPQLRGKGMAIAGLILSGLWLVVGIAVIAIGLSVGPQRSSSGQVTQPGVTSVYSLRTADCLQNPGARLGIRTVRVVPCDQPHNAQVFAVFPVAGSGYPGTTALQRRAAVGCHARIAGSINRSLITNSMTLQYLYPESQSWAAGHQSITCLVVDSANMTSSVLLG
jgi:Domain of unknown function (DUF4190)/Septum formation